MSTTTYGTALQGAAPDSADSATARPTTTAPVKR